ncbi:MAG: sirohydrochlorin cobaltochelatase [Fusobacteria bacterium]|nr:MAG: sirohydrochlorin cobaltochelatase [Fusobacteriota bacterium]KAF0230183.1 MAG: sirohydrochlorin [Fusobacteriota bacterium]
MLNKKAVAFVLTSSNKTGNENFQNSITEKFKEYEIYLVTSQELETLLQRLDLEKYNTVIVQPITIIEGIEYNKIKETALIYQGQFNYFRIGKPLLDNEDDILRLVEVLKDTYLNKKPDQGVIWVGHGSRKSSGETFKLLSKVYDNLLEREILITLNDLEYLNVFMDKINSWKVKELIIAPFFIMLGNHYKKEVISDDVTSLRTFLLSKGFMVNISYQPLISQSGIIDMYKEKIQQEE